MAPESSCGEHNEDHSVAPSPRHRFHGREGRRHRLRAGRIVGFRMARVTSLRCKAKSEDRRHGLCSFIASSISAGPRAKFIEAAPRRPTLGWVAPEILTRFVKGCCRACGGSNGVDGCARQNYWPSTPRSPECRFANDLHSVIVRGDNAACQPGHDARAEK